MEGSLPYPGRLIAADIAITQLRNVIGCLIILEMLRAICVPILPLINAENALAAGHGRCDVF